MVPLSILDLAPIRQGSNAARAYEIMRAQARHAERLGYHRYWIAEHHNMPGIGSSATAVLIGNVAEATSTIRVGSGGIMLPNHTPLVVAEQFGTLASLYPGRIDLGLGRAPGTDQHTAHALRRGRIESSDQFPQDVLELQAYFEELDPEQPVRAVPGAGLDVPIWLLGSSLFSAQLAAHLGLPYAFASHFAPDYLLTALDEYRTRFKPSAHLVQPYAMVGVNVVAAETDDEAGRLFTSAQMQSVNMLRGKRVPLGPPIDGMDAVWTAHERESVNHKHRYAYVGSPGTVRTGLEALLAETGADELIVNTRIYDPQACLDSFSRLAEVHADLS